MESDLGQKLMHEILIQAIADKLSHATKEIAKSLAVMSVGQTPEARAITVREGIRVVADALPEMVEDCIRDLKIKMDAMAAGKKP